jgi:dihydroorotase
MSDKQNNRLLLQGGEVFDTTALRFQRHDVRVVDGSILEVGPNLAVHAGEPIQDCRGTLVLPALLDIHLHCFRLGQVLSIDAEELAPRSGTTTFVDAGSSGSMNFQAFREHVIEPAGVRILAFLNVSAIGMVSVGASGVPFFENDDDRLLDAASAIEVIEKNRDLVVGVKVRAYTGLRSLAALRKGREVAEQTRLPVMVHIASGPPAFEDILPFLRPGDIVTHTYHGGADSLLDGRGRVRPVFHEARARGVEFDVGLDRVHTSFEVARRGLAEGFGPDYLSTDMTTSNRHVTVDLPTTISKFVALGMSLEAALAATTSHPATKLGLGNLLGGIRPGAEADLATFDLQEGGFEYLDTYGTRMLATQRLVPLQTLRRGKPLEPIERKTRAYDFVMK